MSPFECILIASVAPLLLASLAVVRYGRPAPARQAVHAPPAIPPQEGLAAAPEPPPEPMPEGSVSTDHLKIGQTLHVRTESAKYALTLRNPEANLYDAVRVVQAQGHPATREAFQIFFNGTLFPGRLSPVHRWFIPGGRLRYHKVKNGEYYGTATSKPVRRILFSVPVRQAS